MVTIESGRPNKLTVWDYATLTQKFIVAGSFDDGDINHFLRSIFSPDGRLVCMINRNSATGWVPAAVTVDLDSETVTETNGLIGVDVISPNKALYLSDGLHQNWLGGSICGTGQPSQLILGRLDLDATDPLIIDGWHLFAEDATEATRSTRMHSTLNSKGDIVYVASSPSVPLEAGAVCTCNTVAGLGAATAQNCGSGGSGGSCTCNTVCICVPVYF
jgi:hypothetical protein